MDREARGTFELLEEIEKVLRITANPVTWPIGMGPSFRGVYHRLSKKFYFFEASEKAGQAAIERSLPCDPTSKELLEFIEPEQQEKLVEEIDLLESALGPFKIDEILKGQVTPALFGSARNNFGVPTFLDVFKEFAPAPQPKTASPAAVRPEEPRFSAFVFKIQANMDKAHRDRMAILRICSGRFERDMDVKHARLEKTVRLSHSKQFLAQDRSTINEAYAGDIIGIHDPGNFRIGDTVYTGPIVRFENIPQFSPERFGKLRLRDPIKRKQLQKGVEQLCEEGLVQMFVQPSVGLQDPILGVVGTLQFDVMMFRLKDEYGVDAVLDRLPYTHARWLRCNDPAVKVQDLDLRVPLVKDSHGHWVVLASSEWELQYLQKNSPATIDWLPTSEAASAAAQVEIL